MSTTIENYRYYRRGTECRAVGLINRVTVQVGTGSNLGDKPTSMIGLCQEGKSSPDALVRSAGVIFLASARVLASRPGFLIEIRTRLPLAGAASLAAHQD